MPELLKPGRKRDLVYEVTKFLYFDYVVTERWVRRKTDTHRDERYRVSTFSDLEPWDIRARGYIAAFDPHCPPKKREELPGDHLLSAEEVHHNDNDNDDAAAAAPAAPAALPPAEGEAAAEHATEEEKGEGHDRDTGEEHQQHGAGGGGGRGG